MPEYIYIYLNPDRLSRRNDVTLDKVNVRLDTNQNFKKKIMTLRLCAALKTIWSYISNLGKHISISIQ